MSSWDWPGSQVTRVVDGDSFYALVTRDLGFGGTASFTVKLRLDAINAPPAHTTAGRAATALATALMLTPRAPVHIVTVGAYKYGVEDSPGEWMARVTLADGRDVAAELVAAGLAVSWDGTGPRPGG